ncbi:hypothetical protein ACFQY4_11840 [Catellatospora bangladeshensis]|uniref:hypothetical protein n=1 Tax=Catellatospora bangladeshensis TaxID=310355 RepID=UPI0036137EE4
MAQHVPGRSCSSVSAVTCAPVRAASACTAWSAEAPAAARVISTVCWRSVSAVSSAGVPRATSRPAAMTCTSAHSCSTSAR